ncbi:hypothetical protein RBA71_04570 [Brenneria goodwinii]|uniref:hypothetical protein n=1 Tax=Brenneria goodwinii TaxID=1109412 RepID=UPI0036EBE9FA
MEGDGHISTSGGKLHLNTSGAAPGTSAPGEEHKSDINAAVEAQFPQEKKAKKGAAPASASPAPAAAKPAAPEVKQQAQSGEKADTLTQSTMSAPSFTGYGSDVDGLVKKSPTLTDDINRLKKRGWTFKVGEAGKGTFASRTERVITIDKNELNDPLSVVQSLSHESGHALYDPQIDLSSRENYLNSTLSDEGAATLNNIKVQREIIANQGEDIGIAGNFINHAKYNDIYNSMKKGDIIDSEARKKIGRIFGRGEQTSNTGQYYEDYYGGWYDKNYPKK